MTIRPRAVRLLEYLEAVRGLREQPVRDVAGYQDRRWWAGDVPADPACVLTETGAEPWLTVSKAPVPSVPLVPEDVTPHLETGVTDPETEPSFSADFDDQFVDDPMEAARLRELPPPAAPCPDHRDPGAPELATPARPPPRGGRLRLPSRAVPIPRWQASGCPL
jgi:hypothetical protein